MDNLGEIIEIIKTIRSLITEDADVVWAGLDDVSEIHREVDTALDSLSAGDVGILKSFSVNFAPTGKFQEISISNGWGAQFIPLADRFDELYSKIKRDKAFREFLH